MSVKISAPKKAQLYKNLAATVPAVEGNLRDALRKSGKAWAEKARSLVPVDSGDLRNSIRWSFEKPKDTSGMVVSKGEGEGGNSKRPSIYLLAGGKKAYYARFVEFGVVAQKRGQTIVNKSGRARKSKRSSRGRRPQPFFYPSYRILRRGIRSRLTRAMNKAIRDAGFGKK